MTDTATPDRPSARQRLLAAADELFYEEGLNLVGIDRVIERAGVAKASLYSTFGSKDELIRAYLAARHEARQARITARLQRCNTPRDRLLGVFDAMAELFAEPGYRGCVFMRANAEARAGSSARTVCDEARQWTRELFTGLAREAGAPDPAGLAARLHLLYDGAGVSAQMDGGATAALLAREMAAQLLDAAIGTPRRKTTARPA
jgi:AcrR family transcriptional regulator